MTPELVGSFGFVESGVKEVLIVGPRSGVVDVGDLIGQCRAGAQVFEAQSVDFRAIGVGGIGEDGGIRADNVIGEREIALTFGEWVAIEQDFFGPADRSAARRQWMGYCLPCSMRV